ncbi:MAG: lipoprotein-releasing ABC transporter permease subunit [Alphaproteobacteria bacterium]|nr:lipoprotein-releasing ABC transporter permease subunit [Alphaproteobacteria bacterium]
MFSRAEWMVAGRYMGARKQENFISVIAGFSLLGIALGVATLIIVLSVMNGFRTELLDRVLGLNGHMSVFEYQKQMTDYDALAEALASVPTVVAVTPLIEGQVMATGDGTATGALARGVRREDLMARAIVADNIVAGSFDSFHGLNGIILGAKLAERLGVTAGGDVTLISPDGNIGPFGTIPRMKTFNIAATFEVGMYEYDNTFIYLPLEAAQIFFRYDGTVQELEFLVEDPDDIDRSIAALDQAVRELNTGKDLRLVDWRQRNLAFFNALEVERNVMFLILTLIIVVAAFNIISSLIMLVKDKTEDIAILRTMGATRGMVTRVFLIAGASIGVIGTLAGTGLGLAVALNIETIRRALEGLTGTDLFSAEIYFLSQLPAEVNVAEVVMVSVIALGLTFMATIYPSWRAARVDPIEALRNG